ncbi:MAG: MazG nucleotide pyrophosphohydrolase domain-containing protein, partial [Armatimonadota bacterium]|nr:MazG nucleotide pyrophosphohydrolase domain-containing protein [Armatimonadota bacterium]
MEDLVGEEFAALVETVKRLRSPEGCPWDRQQTHESLKRYVIEETYEFVEAVDSGDEERMKDELGDLLLQVILHAQIASERGQFGIADVCRTIREKLQRRHPHVFGSVQVSGVDE